MDTSQLGREALQRRQQALEQQVLAQQRELQQQQQSVQHQLHNLQQAVAAGAGSQQSTTVAANSLVSAEQMMVLLSQLQASFQHVATSATAPPAREPQPPTLPKYNGDPDGFAAWAFTARQLTSHLQSMPRVYAAWAAALVDGALTKYYAHYATLEFDASTLRSLGELIDHFAAAFCPPETATAREHRFLAKVRFVAGKAGALTTYIKTFEQEVARHAYPPLDEANKIRYFLTGLLPGCPFLLNMIERHNTPFTTTHALLLFVRGFTALIDGNGSVPFHAIPPTSALPPGMAPMEVNNIGKETRKCFQCGMPGHIKRDCRRAGQGSGGMGRGMGMRGRGKGQGQWQRRGRGQSRSAYAAEEEGKEMEEYEEEDAEDRSGQGRNGKIGGGIKRAAAMPYSYAPKEEEKTGKEEGVVSCGVVISTSAKGLPTFSARVHTKNNKELVVKVLIDSGASRNMVSQTLARQLPNLVKTGAGKTTIFRFANGTLFESAEVCREVALQLPTENNILRVGDLLVCQLAAFDIILGREWLHNNNPDIDWTTGKVDLRDGTTVSTGHDQGNTRTEVKSDEGEKEQHRGQAVGEMSKKVVVVEVVSATCIQRTMRKPGMVEEVILLVPKATEAECNTTADGASPTTTTTTTTPTTTPTSTYERISQLIAAHADLFEDPNSLPPSRPGHDHTIETENGAKPPFRHPFRLSSEEKEELRKQLEQLVEREHIRPSKSPYGAPVLFVRKKDGTLRLCIDYRALNKQTIRDRYPLPHIEALLDDLHGATVFSKLDLRSGYHQVRVEEEDVFKTAFTTHMGSFEWRVLPMGLTNAPATFQRLMNSVLGSGPFLKFCRIYLDDVIIFSKTVAEHEQHLRAVMKELRKHQLRLHPGKCVFGVHEVHFLGHHIAPGQVSMEVDKVGAIKEWPFPQSRKQLQSFL